MGSPFNQFTQSFFSSTGDGSLNPDAFSEETRSAAVNANDASAKETAENMRFNYRGKDTFARSLESGPRSNVENAFTKNKRDSYGNKSSYPYLQSRFLINPVVDDPFARNLTQNTVRSDKQNLQLTRAKRGISGPPELLKSYEEAAKMSSKIGDDLQTAMSIGGEKNMSDAVYAAQAASRENQVLSRRPGRDSNGDYITNEPSWQNANMMDGFNKARIDAVAAQDLSDGVRETKGNINRFMRNRKPFTFSTKFDPKSGM
tara:strand:+ start:208 stop:984 length:777 start_codon:yes stop_codon:yes gene_type:complete